MTPAVEILRQSGISFTLHEYSHDPSVRSYGEEAAEALGMDPDRVFKTLLVELVGSKKGLAVGVIPVSSKLDLKGIAAVVGAKKAAMAESAAAEKATGYVVGGISPLGQRKRLPTVVDESAAGFDTICISGGRRGLEIELAPDDLARMVGGRLGPIARR